jgi:flavin reductase (DIM6/NTAB) family NADH-FMN oxidoreductase RutF/DNA-binding IclR family transcriptional regulator
VQTAIDSRQFRETLGHYPTGVALITGCDESGTPVGMVVGSFTSVSLDPPLVAFLPAKSSGRWSRLSAATSFCVNVLSADQEDLCRRFAARGSGWCDDVTWVPTPSGAPALDDAVAWIDCSVESIVEVGDHYLVIGRVEQLEVVNPVAPLLFFQGGYGRFTSLSLVATATPELISAVRHAELARPHLEDLSLRLDLECDALAPVGTDLAFVASAGAGPVTGGTVLGMRVPLMAPLGEQAVAWSSEQCQQQWLDNAGIADPDERQRLRDRLELARRRSWSISRLAPHEETPFYEALREYATQACTPARERAIRSTITELSRRYEPIELLPGQRYDVHSIAVPVHGTAGGPPVLVLRLVHLPAQADSMEVLTWIDELRRTADAVAHSLGLR